MRQVKFVLLMVLGCFFISACSTSPVSKNKTDDGHLVAERFINNIGMGKVSMDEFKKNLLKKMKKTPDMKEHLVGMSEMVSESDFVGYIAKVYARNLNKNDLTSLADMSESATIKRYFYEMRVNRAAKKRTTQMELLKKFNEEEIGEILKFVSSDSFVRLNTKLPIINTQLKQAGREYGIKLFQKYAASQQNVKKKR